MKMLFAGAFCVLLYSLLIDHPTMWGGVGWFIMGATVVVLDDKLLKWKP